MASTACPAHRVGPGRSGRHRGDARRGRSTFGAIPSSYLRYYYQTRQVVGDQRAGHTRAREVIDMSTAARDVQTGLAEKPALLANRGGAYCSGRPRSHRLIARWRRRRAGRRAQRRRPPDLPDDAVVEIQPDRPTAPIPAAGAARARHAPRPRQAARPTSDSPSGRDERRPDSRARAMMANPLVSDYDIAAPLLDALLEANRAHLPRFFR